MAETSTASGTRLRAAIAEEVRALLGRRRMSDIALARAIERSHTYVYRRLTGETAFDADDMERIAETLGVPIVELLPVSARGRDATKQEPATLDQHLANMTHFPHIAEMVISSRKRPGQTASLTRPVRQTQPTVPAQRTDSLAPVA